MRRRPRRFVLFVSSIVCAVSAGVAVPPAAAAAGWSPPVDGPVVRPFEAPASRYAAGHRGTDYRAAAGEQVRAAGPGTVAFAGPVAGSIHVVVAHAGGLRTSYSFLARARVRRGDVVAAGSVVGEAGGVGDGHTGVVHLGLRRGETYLDPALLFAPPDLTEVVHLAPDGEAPRPGPAPAEAAALAAALLADGGGLLDAAGNLVGGVVGLGGRIFDAAGGLVGGGAEALQALVGGVAHAFDRVAEFVAAAAEILPPLLEEIAEFDPVGLGNGMVFDVGRALADWVESRDECDHHAPPADGSGGSAHRAMLVAGINSHLPSDGSSLPRLPADALGYADGDVTYYSYAGGGAYDRDDTYVPIELAARHLADQLRDLQRSDPGREVDLIAHSQGGVVVMAFLKLYYDPADTGLPPLGTVVTLSSPLDGTPTAGASRLIATSAPGHMLLDALVDAGAVPDPDAASLVDLTEGSPLLDSLDAVGLPDQVDLTTIGAALDYVVPASHASTAGATHVMTNPLSFNAHSAVVADAGALTVVRAALEGRPPPCVSLGTTLAGAVVPTVIGRFETLAGLAGASIAPYFPST